ncbi:MAG: 6-bladed beta-propeller [Myxococcota bacterium]
MTAGLRRVALAALAAGCAPRPVGKPIVWPDPPDTPRIRFVTAFRHTSDLDNSRWARFVRAVVGMERDLPLVQPMGVAVSDDGDRIYIADHGGGRVLRADLRERRLEPFAPDEPMGKPFGVALDGHENVYVSDSIGRVVRVLSRDGKTLRFVGKGGLERPVGLAIDRGRGLLYVVDGASRLSPNHRVRAYTLGGQWLRDLGAGRQGAGDGEMHFPTYVAVAADGEVFVADAMNFRIQVFSPDGKFLRKFGQSGDGPGTFSRIKGMDFDSFGNLYVADGGHSNVQIFRRDFAALMFFGGFTRKVEYFDIPSGIAIDRKRNRIYVCNQVIARINVYDLINTKTEDSRVP